MENKILQTKLVEWEKLKLFQPKDLKKMTDKQLTKLKESLKKNGFSSPFYVWEYKDTIYCLDGHHRIPAMKLLQDEGEVIPKKLPANFIECKDKKEAKKAVLIYNSVYANIQETSLNDWIKDLDAKDLKEQIEIKNLELSKNIDGEKPEVEFTEELLEEHNYIVLYFDNQIDWLQALSIFDLKSVKSLDSKKGFEKIGIGRVMNGAEAINKLSQL